MTDDTKDSPYKGKLKQRNNLNFLEQNLMAEFKFLDCFDAFCTLLSYLVFHIPVIVEYVGVDPGQGPSLTVQAKAQPEAHPRNS